MKQFLHLPLFIPTFLAVLFHPVRFYRYYLNLILTRDESFWDLHSEREDDPYLSPVKFSALAMTLSNLVFPMILYLGVKVDAVDPNFVEFAHWAKQQGYLNPVTLTGVGFVDDFLFEILAKLMLVEL